MGIGKTTVSRELLSMLPRCGFIYGDWSWSRQPFTVTDETKAMVLDNITHVLTSFLRCSEFDNIVFCWVMHQQKIVDDILSRLPLEGVKVVSISLNASPEVLTERIRRDIAAGLRDESVISRALSYLPLYEKVQSLKLDTSTLSAEEIAKQICIIGEMNP